MKKAILVFFAAVLTVLNTSAQKGHFFIDIGSTVPNYSDLYLQSKNYTIDKQRAAGQLHFGYFFSDKFSLSLALNGSGASTLPKDVYDGNTYQYSYWREMTLGSFMVYGNYYYIANDRWNVCSGIGIGVAAATVSTTVTPTFHTPPPLASAGGGAWQINAIEAKWYFIKHLGIHANLGYGYGGVFGLGLTGRF